MALHSVTKDQALETLHKVGVQPGDGLMIHSALQYLGRPEGGVGIYLEALCEGLGIELPQAESFKAAVLSTTQLSTTGTLAVPVFNFGFARGQPFDRQNTPSDGMGVFAEYVRQQPGVLRTTHPLQSIAVLGRYSQDLSERDTPCAFDPGSAFDRMVKLDFKVLLLGADIRFVSFVHYCEQKVGVPYRYWKDFTGPVRLKPGEMDVLSSKAAQNIHFPGNITIGEEGWETRTYRMYARDLQLDPQVSCKPAEQVLKQRGQWSEASLNYGTVAAFRSRDFVDAVVGLLEADPWALVQNPPKEIPGA